MGNHVRRIDANTYRVLPQSGNGWYLVKNEARAKGDVIETQTLEYPQILVEYLNQKLKNGEEGGRPNFIQKIGKQTDPYNILCDILELAWIKEKPIRLIAKQYKTSYYTIYRMLKELEASKDEIKDFLLKTPRKKVFFNEELETSDYETVRNYIKRAKLQELKHWKLKIKEAQKCWKFLNRRDPKTWTSEDVINFLKTLPEGSQFDYLVAIRQVAPQIGEGGSDEVDTGKFKEKLRRRKKDIFAKEINMIIEALRPSMDYHETILKLHITLGAREGTKNNSGICGLKWSDFKDGFTKCDLYESKVKQGITWKNCPLTIFWKDLPKRLEKLWIQRGKPTSERVIKEGYHKGLLRIYREIREAIAQYWKGKIDPSLYQELTTLKPHDADKIHVNLLWEANIPLEVVAGIYLGRGEGIGLVGRGWNDLNTIKQHYLSLTQRSQRFQKMMVQLQQYSQTNLTI